VSAIGADFIFSNHGSVCLLAPIGPTAKQWIADNVPDGAMFWGAALVVEPRYVGPLLEGIADAGLEVAQ
jgi:hypothetical protein